jgi:hypothetical protein
MDEYVSKPFEPEVLRVLIESIAAGSGIRGEEATSDG